MILQIIFEFQKVFQKKNLILFLTMICVFNIAVFIYDQRLNPLFPSSSYQSLQMKLDEIPNHQRYEYIKNEYEKYHAYQVIETLQQLQKDRSKNQGLIDSILAENQNIDKYRSLYQQDHQTYYTDSIEAEEAFLKEIYDEFEILHQHSKYLQDIQDKAKTISSISIFQKNNDFSQKNIQKTAEDYQELFHVELTYESQKGINDALSFPMTNLLIMIAMFILASSMIIDEKEKKLFSIIKITPKGQWQLMLSKTIVMVIMVGIMSMIMICSQLIYMYFTVGLGDLSRTLQSLASYNECSYSLNVWQFICIFLFIKWIATSFIGVMMMWLLILMDHQLISLLLIMTVIIIELILYLVISPLHFLYLLKYINLMSFLQIDSLFQVYRNVDFFGHPLSLQWLMICVLIIGFISSIVLCVLTYQYKKNMTIIPIKWTLPFKHMKVSHSLFIHEVYKITMIQRLLFICVICIGLQIYQYHEITIYRNQATITYMEYMKKLEGKLTLKKEQWINQEKEFYDALHKQEELIIKRKDNKEISEQQANQLLNRINQELENEEIFSQVLDQYQRVKDDPRCEFVIPFAYQSLFLQDTWTLIPTLLLCLFLIIGTSQVFLYDYQNNVQRITLITVNGKQKMIQYKFMISVIICLIFLLIFAFPLYVLFQHAYGFSSLSASVISIEQLAFLPADMSIAIACLLSLMLDLFAVICMIFVMFALSLKVRNHILTCFISLFIFLVPLLLSYGGFHLLDPISLYPLLMNGQYVQDHSHMIQLFCSFIGYLVFMIYSIRYIYKHYTV